MNKHRFDRIMTSTRTTQVEAKPDALWVTFEAPVRRRSRNPTTPC